MVPEINYRKISTISHTRR